jgi:hypothetical protein
VTFTLFSPPFDAIMVDGGDSDGEGLMIPQTIQFVGKAVAKTPSQP